MTRNVDFSSSLEAVDRQIIHALQIDARSSFAQIATVIGVSEQTVARRFRRLQADGVVRVVGMVEPGAAGLDRWILRIQCRPDAAGQLAEALARRDDVTWVNLSAGGSEVICSTNTQRGGRGQDLLLHRLPRTTEVRNLSAYSVLHDFETDRHWMGFGADLNRDQADSLRTNHELDPPTSRPSPAVVTEDDEALMAMLGRDGRSSLKDLAAATGWSAVRVSRRIAQLRAARAIYFHVDLDVERLGFALTSYLWVTVSPRDLESVGQALVRHAEVAYCAAVTGSANIMLVVISRDSADLYRYVTTKLGALDSIREIETSPLLRRIKQTGTILTSGGLMLPTAALSPATRPRVTAR
jgi:DNA-binding Lrp family transcriptional regulator